MIKINGGLNYSSILYTASGIDSRRDPFTWYLNGNININIIDFNIPLNYSYSNQRGTFTQPFNQVSISPTYKWIKTYAGYNTMAFSPYTLAGHIFLGGGAELSPANWKFSAMYGQLKKAIPFDAINNSDVDMSYKRKGQGARAGYEKNGQAFYLTYFSAKDDPNSIPFIPQNSSVNPMANTALSVNAKTTIYKTVKVEGEYAISGITRNVLSENETNSTRKNKLPGIFEMKTSSGFFSALKTSAGIQGKKAALSLNYERVDPGYQTLGAYYFNNDIENITLAPSASLFKGKLSLSANTGFQRNNLDGSKLTSTKRWVGSANVGFSPSQKWNLNMHYSNFNTFTRQRPQTDPFFKNTLDTLNFYQLTRNAAVSASYTIGNTNAKHSLLLNGSYQVMGQKSGVSSEPGVIGSLPGNQHPSTIYSGNTGYVLAMVKTHTTLSVSLNVNKSQIQGLNTLYYGPSINASKGIKKNKIRLSVGSSFNKVLLNGKTGSSILNHRIGFNYYPKVKNDKIGKFNVTASGCYLQKLKVSSGSKPFSELTGNVGVSYGF